MSGSEAEATHVEHLSSPRVFQFVEGWYELGSTTHFWFQWRFRAFLRAIRRVGIPMDAPLRALEIGCGHGVLRTQVEDETRWVVDGTDLDADALSKIRPSRGRTLYYDITDEHPSLLAIYDVVLLFDVLEHIASPAAFLASAVRHLKPGGTLVINVPALMILYSEYDTVVGHLRRYTPRTLSQAASECSIEMKDLSFWGFSMVPVLLARKLMLRLLAHRSTPEKVLLGFKPRNEATETMLRAAMKLELAVLHKPPLGTSLLLVGRKS